MKKINEKYIYLTKDGRYRVQIRPNKKIKSKFDETFDNLDIAKDERDKFLAKQKLGINIHLDKNITFSDFCDRYFEWYKNKPKKPSPNTLTDYASRIRSLKRYFKNDLLYRITTTDIETFLSEESKRFKIDPNNPEKITNEKISSNTVNHEFVMLRILFKKAVAWKVLSENPMDAVEEPKIKIENEVEHLPYEEFEQTVEIIEKNAFIRDKLIFYFGLCGGLREEEICGLHYSENDPTDRDIDFTNNHCYIKRAVKQNYDTREYEEYDVKSEYSERGIPLPDFVINTLEEYLKYREQLVKLLKTKYKDNYKNLSNLFLNQDGDYFRPRYVGKLWSKFKKKHNIKPTFHGLRHSYITYQMNYNDDLTPSEVQALAGHANITTTYKYVHKSEEKLKKATTVFDNVFNNKIDINNDNTIYVPIMYIASIVTGIEFVEIDKIKNFLSIMNPNDEITFNNLSSTIENTKNYLIANYPSLENISVLNNKYTRDEFEQKLRSVYGNKMILDVLANEKEL